MLVHIMQHIILFAPTWVESFLDRNGDPHADYYDVFVRAVMIVITAGLIAWWRLSQGDGDIDQFVFLWAESGVMSLAYFFGAFQYLVNWYERKVTEKDWRKHLNDDSIPDRWKWYRNLDWRLRMVLHGLCLVTGWIYYYY